VWNLNDNKERKIIGERTNEKRKRENDEWR
jgi:hypothetical protein